MNDVQQFENLTTDLIKSCIFLIFSLIVTPINSGSESEFRVSRSDKIFKFANKNQI